MKHVFAVQSREELDRYQSFAGKIQPKLDAYLTFLRETCAVTDLPRAVIWANREIATHLISDIPLPCYTNEFRTVFCPDMEVWQEIYLKQLDGISCDEIRDYYESQLTQNSILQILGHEFVHHSNLFLSNFEEYDTGIWFEEGMCEYISRKYFLTAEEYALEAHINAKLVSLLKKRYGTHSLEDFGAATYAGDYAGIFFQYWRSFLAVDKIADAFGGDIPAVFQSCRDWDAQGRQVTLEQWFQVLP